MPRNMTKTTADNGAAECCKAATRMPDLLWRLKLFIGRHGRRMTSGLGGCAARLGAKTVGEMKVRCKELDSNLLEQPLPQSDRTAMTASDRLMMDHQKERAAKMVSSTATLTTMWENERALGMSHLVFTLGQERDLEPATPYVVCATVY
ncbi:hypothetical protein NUW58_g1437 [Xylaria curta]|uniref:Uncharacterized protein n=1 Tax=Xylaria curta TaxID=42375 RepID=A0ACC1PK48_9PEZI|nr:hypothetical protein NUW58_g1437 [Xylaria curta]